MQKCIVNISISQHSVFYYVAMVFILFISKKVRENDPSSIATKEYYGVKTVKAYHLGRVHSGTQSGREKLASAS